MDGARRVRRTFDAAIERYPVWSPDGNLLAFVSERKGVADLYRKHVSGVGGDELLWESPYNKNVDDWSPDGRFLLYNEEDPVTLRNLWVLPLDGDRKRTVFLKTNSEEHRGQFSPNGRFVAYVSNEPGQHQIFVRPFPASDNQWQVSSGGGIQPRWSHDGKELYYIALDGKLMAVTITMTNGAIEAGTPKPLFQTRTPGGAQQAYSRPQYDVSSDGRFLINTIVEGTATSPITLLLNWKPNQK
jgi:Tol biopolymer transport system component